MTTNRMWILASLASSWGCLGAPETESESGAVRRDECEELWCPDDGGGGEPISPGPGTVTPPPPCAVQPGTTPCYRSGSTVPYCARLSSDAFNCGGCGNECALGQTCEDGVCEGEEADHCTYYGGSGIAGADCWDSYSSGACWSDFDGDGLVEQGDLQAHLRGVWNCFVCTEMSVDHFTCESLQ